MPVNPERCGRPRAGYIRMTHSAGSCGIAGIIWGVGMKMMSGRSNAGRLIGGTCLKWD
jgi:hypothetical protein